MKDINYNEIKKKIKAKKEIYLDSFSLELGLPLIEVRRILNKLAITENGKIRVDDNGKLIYLFEDDLQTTEEFLKFLYDLLITLFKMINNLFISISKILMLLVFISYSFIYIILLFMGFILSTVLFSFGEELSKNQDELGLIGRANGENFSEYLSDFTKMMTYAFTLKSFHEDGYNMNVKRAFHKKIFSFIFGDYIKRNRVSDDINIMSFIHEYKKITISDIINLTGLIEKEAEKIILSLVVKYDGEILVNDSGIIYYTFNYFDFKGLKAKRMSYVWENKIPENKMNLNDSDTNTKIIIFGIINITLSTIVALGMFDDMKVFPIYIYTYLKFWYGDVSLFFSMIFFIFPILRIPFVKFKKRETDRINYIYYLFNDFSYNINKDYVDMDETDDIAEIYLFKNYPNIFIHDFLNNKNVINLIRYHEEIKFSSNNNPENIRILNPDDVDFLDNF